MINETNCTLSILNNASLSAFIGAFSAFFLVYLTDWRRKYGKRKLIKLRLKGLRDIAINKKRTAENQIQVMSNNKFIVAPVMRFPVDDLRYLQRETLDILSSTHIIAIDALISWLEAIDGIFAKAFEKAEGLEKLQKGDMSNSEISLITGEIKSLYSDAIRNLEHLEKMMDCYVNDEPEKVLEDRVEKI